MRAPRLALLAATLLAASLLLVFLPTRASAAPPDEVCRVNEQTRRLDCVTDHEQPGVTPVGVGERPDQRPTAVWRGDQLSGNSSIESYQICTTGDGRPGTVWRFRLVDLATGSVLQTVIQCVGLDDPTPTPAQVPAPPTIEELLDSAPIPEPVLLADPAGRGLTGLESRFWAEDPGDVTASVDLRGWTVTGALRAERWIWTTGDGGRYESSDPGSADQPAAMHTYQTKDTWSVAIEVRWRGSFTVSGFGTSYTVAGLATTSTTSVEYPVIEVRGVVDEPQPAA